MCLPKILLTLIIKEGRNILCHRISSRQTLQRHQFFIQHPILSQNRSYAKDYKKRITKASTVAVNIDLGLKHVRDLR